MLSESQLHCLDGIGITVWQRRSATPVVERAAEPPSAPPPLAKAPVPRPVAPAPAPTIEPANPANPSPVIKNFELDDWTQLSDAIEACQNCELAQSCTRKVPGKGSQTADLMIIGEAPGHEEDRHGKPFVGRAGQLLDRMLRAIELDPAEVYITNILKCRPPNNRDPRPDEVVACSQFLNAQIQLLKPKVIFSVGRVSAQNLLKNQTPVGRLRGQTYTLADTDIPLLVTYHPAYLLRSPAEKAKSWEDLKSLRRLLSEST
jgi:uracil-DNA glycosylase family 4